LCRKSVHDKRVLDLLWEIITSFETKRGKGIPLGNLTSQLFSNIYLNPLDQFVKRELKVKNYVRYADDFVLLSCDKNYLESSLSAIASFLDHNLNLSLHAWKVLFRKYHQGVDFLGYVQYPNYRVLRTRTKKRMLKRISEDNIWSYLGLLRHGKGRKLKCFLRNLIGAYTL